ncbi:MAG: hypothetical protein VYC00_00375, partial [Candidatus Neomarinimicrobiota bacterium]|nr:hypothetical protein [Candidatus Neomarinimicrobiota bacterium]
KYTSAKSSMSSPKLEIDLPAQPGQLERSVSEQEVSRYVEARMQEIFQMTIREISRADIKDPLTYGLVLTGGGSHLKNIVPLAEETLGVKVRLGNPIKIDGIEGIADDPQNTTVMGLLLWPLYANDHTRLKKPVSGGFSEIIEKIRHTIEDIF